MEKQLIIWILAQCSIQLFTLGTLRNGIGLIGDYDRRCMLIVKYVTILK